MQNNFRSSVFQGCKANCEVKLCIKLVVRNNCPLSTVDRHQTEIYFSSDVKAQERSPHLLLVSDRFSVCSNRAALSYQIFLF